MEREMKVKEYNITTGRQISILSRKDAEEMDIHAMDRLKLESKTEDITTVVDISEGTELKHGEIGLFNDVLGILNVKNRDTIKATPVGRPESVDFIKRKLKGEELTADEIRKIVYDTTENNLSEIELAALISAVYIHGWNIEEIIAMTQAMVDTGDRLELDYHPVVDKHCIGGIAGNRTTMILVPIVAALGLKIPKTSSRAITSPSGTADTMEVLCDVNLSIEDIEKQVKKIDGCIAWGGAVNLAPADDKFIQIEHPLSLDPEGQVIASVMAKKASVGADCVVIDIPVGDGAKIPDEKSAAHLSRMFLEVASKMNMNVECVISPGNHPIGKGIGPVLEARDVLEILQSKGGPSDLREKSICLTGVLLEMSGVAKQGGGYSLAQSVLNDGKAWEKMKQIIEAQGGNPNIKINDLPFGDKRVRVYSTSEGRISYINNRLLSAVAREAGAPKDKGAGIDMMVNIGQMVKVDDPLFEIYAENSAKLSNALKMAQRIEPIGIEKMIMKRITSASPK